MPDMLVKLYNLKDSTAEETRLKEKGISIKRVLPPDKSKVLDFLKENFHQGWADEAEYAIMNQPVSCYIAVKNKEVVGVACYDATAKDFFGPLGVAKKESGQGIGGVLLKKCLHAMREQGYGYAIIGDVDDAQVFYEKTVSATVIEDSKPGVYQDLINN